MQRKYSEALEVYKEELKICEEIMPNTERHADVIFINLLMQRVNTPTHMGNC